MKWIRHMAATTDDEKIARLIGDGGQVGLARYGAYWRVNEIIAAQMEGPEPSCSVSYPISVWARKLPTRGSLVMSTLSSLAASGLVTLERDGDGVRVGNRNLLKYRDEYSRKSGHKQDDVPARTHQSRTEKEQSDENAREARSAPAPPLDDWNVDPEESIPDGLSVIQYRQFVCERLRAADTNAKAFESAIRAVAHEEEESLAAATRLVIERGRANPPVDGNWWKWVSNGRWQQAQTVGVSTEGLE